MEPSPQKLNPILGSDVSAAPSVCLRGRVCISPGSPSVHGCGFQAISLIALMLFLSNLPKQRPFHHVWSLNTHWLPVRCCANVYIHVRKRLRVYNDMSWDLSRTRASEMPKKEEKGRKTAREKKDGMMDETYHAICFLKRILSSFLSPLPSLKWLSTPVYSRSVALEKNSPAHLMLPLEIVYPPWEGEKGKWKWKGRMHFKECWSGHSGKRKTRVILLWHFSSLLSLLTEWWGSQACFCSSGTCMYAFVCGCVQ